MKNSKPKRGPTGGYDDLQTKTGQPERISRKITPYFSTSSSYDLRESSIDYSLHRNSAKASKAAATCANPRERNETAWKLIGVKRHTYITTLIHNLQSPDLQVRTAAIDELVRLRASRAVEPLGALLKSRSKPISHSDYRLSMKAADALAVLGEVAVPTLLEIMREGTEYTQMLAATALTNIGRPAVNAVINELVAAPLELRRKLIWILQAVKDHRAVPQLIKLLEDDDSKVRRYAAWALGEIGEPSCIPALIAALEDRHGRVRWDAAKALEKFGKAAIPALVDCLYSGRNPRAREAAANALAWTQDTQAIESLTYALYDPDVNVRVRAAFGLGWIGSPLGVEPLIDALSDEHEEVVLQAVLALGWIRDQRAVEPLIRLLEHDTDWITYAATEALGDIGDKRAIKPLTRTLRRSNHRIHKAVRDALSKLGSYATA